MAGLWGGYFLFGLVFTYHIHTHGYYSLQFVPIVALSLGPLWDLVEGYIGRGGRHHYRRTVVLGLVVIAVGFAVVEQRATISGIAQQAGGAKPFSERYMG